VTVAVCTPWQDHRELAADYFYALEMGPQPDEVVIVDNGSTPPLEFATIRLDHNHGFSAGSNRALEAATADVAVFLNNDIEVVEAEWLEKLVASVEPGVLVGARLRNDAHGAVDGHAFPYLDGWCLAGMREDLREIGGFDETFAEPAYYSDNDLCLRARLAGMRLRECPVGLLHKENKTAGPGFRPDVQAATQANYQRFAERARKFMAVAA
jgi:GT2 family glycosyltransferase